MGLVGACGGNVVSPASSPLSSIPIASSVQPLTPGPSPTVIPSPSPSLGLSVEGQIVFEDAGDNFRYTQIWIENADGSNVRKLVSDGFTDGGPVLSPDGYWVVFNRGFDDDTGQVMIVNIDGSGLREVTSRNPANGCGAGVEGDGWSPDGHRLALTKTCFDRGQSFLGQGLQTIGVDGAVHDPQVCGQPMCRNVTHNEPAGSCPPPWSGDQCVHLEDHRASWSPDGRRFVFQRIDTSTDPERSAVFTIGIDGKGLRQVTPWKLDANDPDWSPDGSLIVFNSPAESGGDQNIYTIGTDGTGLTKLTSGLSTYPDGGQATFHPSWSPGGTRILFTHAPSTGGFGDLFVMNRDGSDLHVLALTAIGENHASWGKRPEP
jgi:Tol biopolymer transport system component